MGVFEEEQVKYVFSSDLERMAAIILTSVSKFEILKSATKLFDAKTDSDFFDLGDLEVLGAILGLKKKMN